MPANSSATKVPADQIPAFHWRSGTVQLFICAKDTHVFFPCSMPQYDVRKPVGTVWKRRYADRAVELLNKAYAEGERRTDDAYLSSVVEKAKAETPFER